MFADIDKIAIVAGEGPLPIRLAESLVSRGKEVAALCIDGYSNPTDFADICPAEAFRLGNAKHAIGILKERDISNLVLVGRINRPTWRDLRPDSLAIRILGSAALSGGDDALLRRVIRYLEQKEGLTVWPITDILEELVVGPGLLGGVSVPDGSQEDITRGVTVLREMGPLDIGQAVVCQHGLVLGVEAAEGTDRLIRRCADYRRPGRGPVLVKLSKPGQIDKADLPTIGPNTILGAAESKFSGIVVEAERTLVVSHEETIREADSRGLFVLAIDSAGDGRQ